MEEPLNSRGRLQPVHGRTTDSEVNSTNELFSILPDDSAAERGQPDARLAAERERRARMLRRLRVLLAAGSAAFALTIWLLVRVENPARLLPPGGEPARIVRIHLAALNRGELREAYALFSPHYREEVSFDAYHELIVTHRRMFRTRLLALSSRESSGDRAVLDTRLLAADGEHYVARFTLVRAGDRWWIDDLRWGSEAEQRRGVIAV